MILDNRIFSPRQMIAGICLLCAVLAAAPPAQGQCSFEWKPGNGLPGLDGGVNAMVVWDDGSGPALYVGGSFHIAGNVLANNIAKWNGTSWSALGSGVSNGTGSSVHSFTVYNGSLIVGGLFTTAGGINANRIAQWNGSSWSALGSGMSGGDNGTFVFGLTVYNGTLIAGGRFTIAGGVSARHIAQWNGTSWSALGSGMNGTSPSVGSVIVYNGVLIAGGSFTTAGGVSVNNIAQWNGSSWSSLSTA